MFWWIAACVNFGLGMAFLYAAGRCRDALRRRKAEKKPRRVKEGSGRSGHGGCAARSGQGGQKKVAMSRKAVPGKMGLCVMAGQGVNLKVVFRLAEKYGEYFQRVN